MRFKDFKFWRELSNVDGFGTRAYLYKINLSAKFDAPYSPGLVLRRPGAKCTLFKRLKCALLGYHEIDSITSPSSMDYDTLHCRNCDSFFDSAFFDATANTVRNGGGYDGTTYRIILKDGEDQNYDSPERRARRDLVTAVMAVVAGAPIENLPEDCRGIVEHWTQYPR